MLSDVKSQLQQELFVVQFWWIWRFLWFAFTGGSIYAVGGYNRFRLKTAERYDVASDRWERIADMDKFRSHTSSVAVGGKIVVLGGMLLCQYFCIVGRQGSVSVCLPKRKHPCEVVILLQESRMLGAAVEPGRFSASWRFTLQRATRGPPSLQ